MIFAHACGANLSSSATRRPLTHGNSRPKRPPTCARGRVRGTVPRRSRSSCCESPRISGETPPNEAHSCAVASSTRFGGPVVPLVCSTAAVPGPGGEELSGGRAAPSRTSLVSSSIVMPRPGRTSVIEGRAQSRASATKLPVGARSISSASWASALRGLRIQIGRREMRSSMIPAATSGSLRATRPTVFSAMPWLASASLSQRPTDRSSSHVHQRSAKSSAGAPGSTELIASSRAARGSSAAEWSILITVEHTECL